MTPQARRIIHEVAAERGVTPAQIVSRCRRQKVFRARVEVARRLDARGYSTTQIGAALGHDHTTIVYYLGRAKKKPTPEPPPRWRKPRIAHLSRCKRLPVPEPPKPRKRYLVPYAGAYMPEYEWREVRP